MSDTANKTNPVRPSKKFPTGVEEIALVVAHRNLPGGELCTGRDHEREGIEIVQNVNVATYSSADGILADAKNERGQGCAVCRQVATDGFAVMERG